MAKEILSVKLCEMDDELAKLHSQIRICEQMSEDDLKKEIQNLTIQLEEIINLAHNSLSKSRAEISDALLMEFEVLMNGIRDAFQKLNEELNSVEDPEFRTEKQILTAEYNIDFAVIVAKFALLKSMEAILSEKQQSSNE